MLCRYERTIFKSDKGFCIFAYSTSDESVPKEARNRSYYHDDKIHFTAIGYHLIATDAVEVELDGAWENSKHGLQLSVSMCKEVVPRDQAGILAYLSSGIIKGIGPETAKAIVARFGDKTMEVLEKEPDKLLNVKGIAQKKLKAIMLRRNLLYTAVTRAKAKVILIGQKQAVFVAIHKCDVGQRNTVLADRIVAYYNRELSRRVA